MLEGREQAGHTLGLSCFWERGTVDCPALGHAVKKLILELLLVYWEQNRLALAGARCSGGRRGGSPRRFRAGVLGAESAPAQGASKGRCRKTPSSSSETLQAQRCVEGSKCHPTTSRSSH